ncbi:hypothetical protein WJX73_001652 [Symbiochloris irregularis]|uniref:DUF4258 domain-containing protein n=1 Tax=Symbiochloris irregularis TaxID=706552 RepID=A0AAW1P8L1_9CHLO
MPTYRWSEEALKRAAQRSISHADVYTVLAASDTQVVPGTNDNTEVYQQLHSNGRRLLRIVVARQPDPQNRTVIVTLYDTTKVAKYWQTSND